MGDISNLEERANTAIEKMLAAKSVSETAPQPSQNAQPAPIEEPGTTSQNSSELERENEVLREKLERETRTHEALQVEFLDVCQDFGAMELDIMGQKAENSSASSSGSDQIEALKKARSDDIEEVEAVIAKIAPLVGD